MKDGIPLDLEVDHFAGWYEVQVTEEDNPVVATLLGPDGEPLLQLHERDTVPFGYQKG